MLPRSQNHSKTGQTEFNLSKSNSFGFQQSSSSSSTGSSSESASLRFRMKELFDSLARAEGDGTSMISLYIPPNEQMHRISHMLNEELATAAHIKSRVNRLAVQEAIRSCIHRVKQYRVAPANGLVLFSGYVKNGFLLSPTSSSVLVDGGRSTGNENFENSDSFDSNVTTSTSTSSGATTVASASVSASTSTSTSTESATNLLSKVCFTLEPLKPITNKMYLCDKRFHVEALVDQLEDRRKYGFVVIDGHGTLFAMVRGSTAEVVQKVDTHLPRKHNKGGQSSNRFARLRL